MFLKKIEMKGFKSFADREVIHFNHGVTGVVGPNGCGKSNISDAIRWVLGEQSVKSMRGDSMTDVIFNGSENRRKVNLAEVTLVFNNENKVLNSDFEEVEITRRLYRDTRESQYLINKTQCRLRDIHDLVMDTGLGRDSLSIISQGTISHFAEAKPEERRLVFEEAAGVSKYKKRKLESINKLERTKDNIDRMQDIVDEIESQMKRLKTAAKKAEKYLAYQSELESVEVTVLVKDILFFNQVIQEKSDALAEFEAEIAGLETRQGVLDHSLEVKRKEIFALDQEINILQDRVLNTVQEIANLEALKVEVEEKRKYTIETGDKKAKAQALQEQTKEAKIEFEDRLARYQELKSDFDLITETIRAQNQKLTDYKQQLYQVEAQEMRENKALSMIKHRLERPFEQNQGVQAVMENKKALYGIHDVVAKLITTKDNYEEAVQTALAGAMMNIVSDDEMAAANAINFLKRNRSGRATFIPLTTVFARSVHSDAYLVSQHHQGFLGLADEFVETHSQYETLIKSLLGNVLVCEDIETASALAKKLKHQYKIVTLEGDVIHRGGVMSGGFKAKTNHSILTLEKELAVTEERLQLLEKEKAEITQLFEQQQKRLDNSNQELMQVRLSLAQLEPLLDVKREKYRSLQEELKMLDIEESSEDVKSVEDELVSQLNRLYMKRDETTSLISLKREERMKKAQAVQKDERLVREERAQLSEQDKKAQSLRIDITKAKTQRDASLERLSSEYQMTYDYAFENVYDDRLDVDRSLVQKLRSDIQKLGNVNLEAPSEYKESKERYEFITKQLDDLIESRRKLLSVIEEMDEIMIVRFKEMFDRVNDELDAVFVALFGGGKARLVLVDPDDLLNTGVDIDVQPPGKSVQNIRLFSGGEKALIAISVLFAIIKARHVPLCVFDEVEAALDQANVERFANYVNNFSQDTQFIIITHRPGTMERCDVLYGVTMPNKGVSTMLKVQLEQAIELKEEA
ncbi:MAG TPA: AAA family ATPase [Erysipelothrix sp.]